MNKICKNCKHWNKTESKSTFLFFEATDSDYDDFVVEENDYGDDTEEVHKDTAKLSKKESFMIEYGLCERNKIKYRRPSDYFLEQVENGEKPSLGDEMIYWDYEGYSANYLVGPEFGCVHFEKKL